MLNLEKKMKANIDPEINSIQSPLEFTKEQVQDISKEHSSTPRKLQTAVEENNKKIIAINNKLH